MHVLCVEDNVDVASLLFEGLTDAGYIVDLAYTGEEALAAVAMRRPDVILLDITLPDIDGFTLCTRFREEQGIPVIMVTARHTTDDMAAGFEHGADDYVTKPFNMQILLRRLEAVTRYHDLPRKPSA
jgi:DNA-binding response OmpR family regulator